MPQKPTIKVTLKLLYALGIKMKDYLGAIGYVEPKKGAREEKWRRCRECRTTQKK